eukprot:s3565_g3.t1
MARLCDKAICCQASVETGQVESECNVLFMVYDSDSKGYNVCRTAVFQQTFVTDVLLDVGINTFTILDGKIIQGGRLPFVTAQPATHVICHSEVDVSNFNRVIEVCSGIGAISTSLPFCQARAECYVDYNERYVEWLDRKVSAPVILGDIGDHQTIRQVSEVTQGCPLPMNGGIACQPFSALGDQRQEQDPRSSSLPSMLKMAYLLRAPVITIECTKEAAESHWVQSQLKSFARQTGYSVHQNILHLHNTWPAYRTRWFAVLSLPMLGITHIPDMPQMEFIPSIMHLMQIHPHLPHDESNQLSLSVFELRHFHDQPKGISSSIINMAKAMPTATHSWGTQLLACHCGCRDRGFSAARIANKGLYAVLIPLGTMVKAGSEWFHGMRHPHPKEVAIINGLDPRYLDNSNPFTLKFLLSGVGQMASPLHGVWLFSNLFFQMKKQGFPIQAQPPRHVIAEVCQELLKARSATWPHVIRNRSTVLFERELARLDHPLTSLHQDDVDPYVDSQLRPEAIQADLGTPMHLTEEEHARNVPAEQSMTSFVHEHVSEVRYEVELDMPSTNDLLAALEPVIIIEDFPVTPPFRVSDLMLKDQFCFDDEPETPTLMPSTSLTPPCATQVEQVEDFEQSTVSLPELSDIRASEHPTAFVGATASDVGLHMPIEASEVGNLGAMSRDINKNASPSEPDHPLTPDDRRFTAEPHECFESKEHSNSQRKGRKDPRCDEECKKQPAYQPQALGQNTQQPAEETRELPPPMILHAKPGDFPTAPGPSLNPMTNEGLPTPCAKERLSDLPSMPKVISAADNTRGPFAGRAELTNQSGLADHAPSMDHLEIEETKELSNSQRKGRKNPRCDEDFNKQPAHQTQILGQNTQQPAEETRKLPPPMFLQAKPDDFPTASGPSLDPQTMKGLPTPTSCESLSNLSSLPTALPAIDITEGSAKAVHAAIFANKNHVPGNTAPQVEIMTTKNDPLTTHDPWARAIKSLHEIPCALPTTQVYSNHGGIHQFANRKRTACPESDHQSKRANLTQTEEPQVSLPPDQDADAAHVDLINVWIGHQFEPLTKTKVPNGTTVGQVAVTEGHFLTMPDPVRPLTAMGSPCPVYHHVQHNQIVFVEDGGTDHVARYPKVDHLNRQDALWQQQGWVADDEMSFYLSMIGQPNLTHTTAPLIMQDDPDDILKFDNWINEAMEALEQTKARAIHTACLHKQHWFPISVHHRTDTFHITTTLSAMPTVQHWAVEAMGNMFQFHYKVAQEVFPADCGFQTIAWIMAQELGDSAAYPMSVEHAIVWREQFARHLINCNHHDRPAAHLRFGGMTDHKMPELAALLQQHGVHADRVESVVNQLVQTLGIASIKSTLGSARPWADLKSKASAQQPPIKLVLSEELQAQIANRLRSGKSFGGKKTKQAKKLMQSQWNAPMASQVQIPDGIFQQQDGTPLGQITLHQLQTSPRGIAVVNIHDAKPFFHLQRPLSSEGIGLLVLDFQDESLPTHHQVLRFPASCPETQEPMILSAALIQLGQMPVHRALPPKPTAVDQVETVVIRAVLFRDQCTFPWTTMQNKPVKALLDMEHFASLSKGDLLDVWDRQFLSKQYQKMKADEADLFSVVLRLQAPSLETIMNFNSKDGLFFEPRTQSGRGPCPETRVVWLPRQSFHDVLIAKQATELPSSIARSGDRYGLRTKAEHAPTIHAQHRPDVAYLDGASTKAYRIAPLPFGSTKESLQKVFAAWEWNARPSHTQGLTPDRQGLVWIAHATAQPNFFIFTMEHGDVLISEIQNHKPVPSSSQGVPVASVRTLRHLNATAAAATSSASDVKGTVDPLQANDPWAGAYKVHTQKQQPSASQLASIESNIEKRVLASIQEHVKVPKSDDMHMDTETDQRVTQLERQVSDAAILAIILTQTLIRVGEAKNPGPNHMPGLTLGAINPTGIMRKASSFSQLPSEPNVIWGICESHLTPIGVLKFKTELRFADKQLSLHHGATAPYRSQAMTAVGGTHVGTAFITSLPSRKLQMHCSPEQWNQARFTMSTFLCNNQWIHGAVFYGFAHRAYSNEVKQATDDLLAFATERIAQNLKGPRFIMGDFNQVEGNLEQPLIWEKMGWREVQVLHQERTGTPIAKTCKQSTTKDYIWVSPELAQLFRSAEVVNHVFPDHGALIAHFNCIGQDTHVYLWRQPKPLPWDECHGPLPEQQYQLPTDIGPDDSCIQIAQALESRMHEHLQQHNKPGLQPQQKGRCQTLNSRKIQSHGRPIKASRHGDVQPEYQGQSLQHQRWFTQLRRFESLARLYRVMPWNHSQFTHAQREWRAILKAPGFSNFRTWWKQLANKRQEAPDHLPDTLPGEIELNAICLTLHAEVRRYESVLQAELISKAKNNRILQPNRIFKDFAKPAVSPVCILQDSVQAVIKSIDHDDCSVTLETCAQFWPGEVVTEKGPTTPIITCEDQMWLESVDGLQPGQSIRQEKFVGQLEEMFERFQAEWQSRWDRHLHTPVDHWDPLLDFFRTATAPGTPQQYQPVTRASWLKSLKRKKTRAAQGPDGWTRQDLINLPLDLTDAIISILNKIEAGQMGWPQQWLVGIVHSLEKYEQPAAVTGYRPITIFSLIYRTWASLRSRELLQHLLPMVSSRSFGNLPHRCTTNMWFTLQQEIENNLSSSLPTCGAVLDIVKCFNHLPRIPILGVLQHMGVCPQVLLAWSKALCQMERRFSIRGSVSPPLRSTTGMAEGCSLSVVGMVACNQLLDIYVQCKTPQIRMLSYVDNMELAGHSPQQLMQATQHLTDILELMDLAVDSKKTYLWSTEGQFRKVFIQNGYQVKTAARDVGAHMQYTRQATNYTITQKIEGFKDRWKSLALSPAAYEQKLRAVKVVAWTSTLHGIASAHLGDSWFDDLRTGAMRALKEHKPGCSPSVHLSLFEHPSADPAFHALWTTITQCRNYMNPDTCNPQFASLATQQRKRPRVGPCSVVMHRLAQIHWKWDDGGFFRDAWGSPIDLWNMPIQALAQRTAEAWRYHVACQMSSRQTFEGLSTCCAAFTMEAMTKQPRDRAILRCAMNGTFFTADHLKHRDTPGDTRCKMCMQPDSLLHRNWECEALAPCRKHMTAEQKSTLQQMPAATHLQGWFPAPSELAHFRQLLEALPSVCEGHAAPFVPLSCHDEPLHYFTDGSCLRPHDKFARICAWGVAVANPKDLWKFEPIASGCLPGRHQTVVRSELAAATAAVYDARVRNRPFCIWSDNARVVSLLHQMYDQPDRQWSPKTANHDAINALASEFREAASLCKGIFKVASHQSIQPSTSAAERWSFYGNETADSLATRAYQSQPRLMLSWTVLCTQLDHMRTLRDAMHRMLIDIGLMCMAKPTPATQSTSPSPKPPPASLPMTSWKLPQQLPPEAHQYVLPETPAILRWVHSLHDDAKPVQRWSWWQLYLDAWQQIPHFGPWYHNGRKQWKPGRIQPSETFLRRAKWFSRYLHKLCKVCQVDLPLQLAMPNGTTIAFWTATLPVQVANERTAAMDEWFGSFLPCAGKTSDLRKAYRPSCRRLAKE